MSLELKICPQKEFKIYANKIRNEIVDRVNDIYVFIIVLMLTWTCMIFPMM